MNKTIVILAGSTLLIGGLAFAQGKPADKPGAAPAAAGAKPATTATAATAGAKPAAAPGAPAGKPAAAPGAPAGKPAAAPGAPAGKPAAAPTAAGAKPHAAPGAKPAEPGKPAAGPAAAAAAPALPPPPKPPAELDESFKYFNGNWRCDTKMPAGSMGPGSPEATAKSTVRFKKILGGWYYQGDYMMKKTKTNPAFKGTFLISYQPGAKMFTITSYDDMGGTSYETSTGYAGDTITFVGEGFMMGQKVKLRESMTRGPDKGASHKVEVDMGKGFQLMGEDVCKR